MIYIEYRIRGLAALRRTFDVWSDPKREQRALADIGRQVHKLTMRRFETETDPWGRPWHPLSPRTLASRKHGGDRILQDTGRMKDSFHWLVEGDAAVVRAGVTYAKHHQFGTINRRTGAQHIPPRPMLPMGANKWPEEYLRDIRAIVRRYYGVHGTGSP